MAISNFDVVKMHQDIDPEPRYNKLRTTASFRLIQNEYESAKSAVRELAKVNLVGIDAPLLDKQLDEHYNLTVEKINNSTDLEHSITPSLPPAVNRKKVKGMVAYRAWNMNIKGILSPAIIRSESSWNEYTYADELPTVENKHGLHAHMLEVYENNSYGNDISGIVDLYGRVIEHSDGVLRGECAKILCIFVEINSNEQLVRVLTGTLELLQQYYPNIPIYPMTSWQKKLYLMREILISCGVKYD